MQERVSSKINWRIDIDFVAINGQELKELFVIIGDDQVDQALLDVDQLVGRKDHGGCITAHYNPVMRTIINSQVILLQGIIFI